ncbi:hypothetical protein ACFLWO_01490 [Chloroflexota bacterium]
MERVCVFCGERPESKTSEHVLPQWLIKLTGDPKRIAKFGWEFLGEGKFVERHYSFDAFKFPACESCNQHFASLEETIKSITQKIMSEECLSELEISYLLDWFDKIRIGMWLGYRYLDKNMITVSPHFFIANRVGQHDRMLAIFKADGNSQGLNFVGCDTPSFAFTPSCFSLRINNFCFLNMSYPYLFCRRIGFPYPDKLFLMEDDRLLCSFTKGRNYIMLPVLKRAIRLKGTELYQPIFSGTLSSEVKPEVSRLYDIKYVRDNCTRWEEGIGKIFMNRGSKLNVYPNIPSKEWIPEKCYPFEGLLFEMQIMALEWQLYIDSLQPSLEGISKEKRKSIAKNRIIGSKYNNEIIKLLRKKVKDTGMTTMR